jgi:hypothetical protein
MKVGKNENAIRKGNTNSECDVDDNKTSRLRKSQSIPVHYANSNIC